MAVVPTSASFVGRMNGLRASVAAVATALAFVSAAGCSTERLEVEPPELVPAAFSGGGGSALPERWWTAFDDVALDGLIDEALGRSFTLQAARERLAQALAVARREGAELYPQASVSESLTESRSHAAGRTTASTELLVGLTLSYELDVWGRLRSRRDAARIDAESAEAALHLAALSLSASIADTWYARLGALEQQRVLEEQARTNDTVLELITLRFRQGRAEAADVFRQRQLVESRRGELILQLARAETLAHALNALIGRAPDHPLPEVGATLMELPPIPAAGIPLDVLQSRPDVLSGYLAVQAADRRLAEAIADRLPRLSISASANTGDVFDNWLMTLAGNLALPVLDGGRRRAEVERNRAVRAEALANYADAVVTALVEVEDALVRERRQAEYVDSRTRQLEPAEHVLDRTHHSYVAGQLDYLRVLEALESRQAIERLHVDARVERIAIRIALARALSSGWPLDPDAATEDTPR